MSLKWSPEINAGAVLQSLIVVGGIASAIAVGSWFTAGVIGEVNRRMDGIQADYRQRLVEQDAKNVQVTSEQSTRSQLIEQSVKAEIQATAEWRTEIRQQLTDLNNKVEVTNKTLSTVMLGLANKVDRKP
jgi:hypothetical protein